MIIVLKKQNILNIFSKGFLYSLILFINLHAISLIKDGCVFSMSSEGISFFDVEIYQSLVSYSTLLAFLFGILVVDKKLITSLNVYNI